MLSEARRRCAQPCLDRTGERSDALPKQVSGSMLRPGHTWSQE